MSDERFVGGVLPFKLVVGKIDQSLTSSTGLLAAVEAWHALHLTEACNEVRAKQRDRGPSDGDWVLGGVLTIMMGGKTVEDIENLKKDEGLRRVLPVLGKLSPRYLLDQLHRYHSDDLIREAIKGAACAACKKGLEPILAEEPLPMEKVRKFLEGQDHGHAFIPGETAALEALDRIVNRRLIQAVQDMHPVHTATLDSDGSIHASRKRQAFWTYDHERGYQPTSITWAEQGLIVADQFRDGNVPASMGNLSVLKRALANLPKSVKKIFYRADSASYDHVLLRFIDDRGDQFAVSARISKQLRAEIKKLAESAWKPVLKNGQVVKWCAELPYVPSEAHERKGMHPFRYVAIRVPRKQFELFDEVEGTEGKDEAPVREQDSRYFYFAVVTNIPETQMDSTTLIDWHREKCGTIESEHDILKHDLAAGTFPSKYFGANAAWYRFNVIARNVFTLLRLGMPEDYQKARPHTIRQAIIRGAGRIASTGRQLFLRVGVAGLDVLLEHLRHFLVRVSASFSTRRLT